RPRDSAATRRPTRTWRDVASPCATSSRPPRRTSGTATTSAAAASISIFRPGVPTSSKSPRASDETPDGAIRLAGRTPSHTRSAMRHLIRVVTTAVVCLSAFAAGAAEPPTAQTAKAGAEEAYIYAYPMLDNYRTMYVQPIDRSSKAYAGPFNQLHHTTALTGPEFKAILQPNHDTPNS